MKTTIAAALCILLLSSVVAHEAKAEKTIDPAPSQNERSHVSSTDRSQIETPGKDHPVDSHREGSREHLDFGKDWNPADIPDDDVTIEYER